MRNWQNRIKKYILFVLIILQSCQITRFVPDNEYLLNKVTVKIDNKTIDQSVLNAYLQQKSNHRMLYFLRLHLWVYNIFKPELKDKGVLNYIAKVVGEPPVVYDRFLTSKTIKQFKKYLKNRGYFNAEVYDSIVKDNQKINLFYIVKTNEPYKVDSVTYEFQDPSISNVILSDTVHSFIKQNVIFDVSQFAKERNRITRQMQEAGYYFFNQENITFQADSMQIPNKINVVVKISDFVTRSSKYGIVHQPHKKCYIKDIYFYPEYDPKKAIIDRAAYARSFDTTKFENYDVIYTDKLRVNPEVIVKANTIEEGSRYDIREVENTKRFLNSLRFFKLVHIRFQQVSSNNDSVIWLNAHYQLTPFTIQSYTFEVEGNNTGNNIASGLNVSYQNRNIFHGAELFDVKVKGSIEATRDVVGKKSSGAFDFNTYEYGVNAKLEFPRFLMPFKNRQFYKKYHPQTTTSFQYDYKKRPDITQTLVRGSFGYFWNSSKYFRHIVTPVEINSVRLPSIDSAYEEKLLDNAFLRSSYDNYFITASSYSMIYSNQNLNTNRNYFYLKFNFELSGNLLSAYKKLSNDTLVDGSYEIFNTKYSQYVKSDFDFRFYNIINKGNRIVYRAFIGLGAPYGNVKNLPYIKQYYAGGANGIRAWRARSLGPGEYVDSSANPNQTAALKLEMNIEYRFHMFWMVEGAFFADAGNIWARSIKDTREGALFNIDTFYKQIALGAGFGLRFDFSFFIFRLDAALKVFDPEIKGRNKFVYDNRKYGSDDYQLHFGIGYPF